MVMDLKHLYLFILGITITVLIHAIFKTPAPIKEGGLFDGIEKLINDIKNIIAFICWFIEFMRWLIETVICLFKYINPICAILLLVDILVNGAAYVVTLALNKMGLSKVVIAFKFGMKGIDNVATSTTGSGLFKYPDVINKMCYSCAIKGPPPPPKPF